MILGLLALQEGAAGVAEPASPFTINGGLIFWTIVIFVILLFILSKTAYPAVLRQVEEREARIRDQLDKATAANAEAERLLADYQAQLTGAKEQAGQIIARARQDGEKLREEIVARGRAEQEELLARARREITMEKDRAVTDLRREAVELSIAAASKVIEKNLDTAADRQLVTDYLASLAKRQS